MRKTKYAFLVLVVLVSCMPLRDISTTNLSTTYRPGSMKFQASFHAYLENDSTIRLSMKINPDEFLFVRQPDGKFMATLQAEVLLAESYESAKTLDSGRASFQMELKDKEREHEFTMPVRISSKMLFLAHCILTDVNRQSTEDFYFLLDCKSKPSRHDFLVKGVDGNVRYDNYLSAEDSIVITMNDTAEQVYCRYYKRDFPLAAPPFSYEVRDEFDYRYDSLFTYSLGDTLLLANEGFYFFQTDTTSISGLTLFRFSQGFPDITTPWQMMESLRYLTTKKEYEEMLGAESPKLAVEDFWLSHGKNADRSRNLIRKYYGRVREANRYFTSYTEGWRTDRGMIYVIFGSPGTVYRSKESESWIYGTPNSSLALNFFFIKVNNPFTENDFTLSRSPSYESNWYRAVEVWRQGRAYNSFN